MGEREQANRAAVAAFWEALYRKDWEAVARCFTADARYTDVPTPDDDVAVGPEQIVARLRLGIEPITGYAHDVALVVAEGDAVVTEHVEHWTWPTGESVSLPFTSVQELRDGRITRWFDYWDLQTLLGAAPAWWIDHIMVGWAGDGGDDGHGGGGEDTSSPPGVPPA